MKKNAVWLLLAITPLVLAACLLVGAADFTIQDGLTPLLRAILLLRASRVAAGFVVGAALACAGTVLQALLRNPLAEPYVLGVSGGSALGAALAIFFGAAGVFILPASAFVAGVLALLIVYLLAHQGGAPSLYALLLSGVIISSICSSLLMLIIALAPVEGLHSITWWLLGNLQVTSLPLLAVSATLVLAAFGGLWLMARELNALTLGREMAHHLGVRTGLVVTMGLALATLMTAAAVALAGLIGFVGLIVPHAMRALLGPDHRRLIPASALAGGLFLTLADTLARALIAPIEIPVGVITALMGGPFFLVLLRRRRHGEWSE
ncbi:MAG: iron ABC transporter permease [Lentisphaerae bacterium]|nr:iron ABC transporter permease [Lentisphaerota bacterium]